MSTSSEATSSSSSSETSEHNVIKPKKQQTPLRILATFYFQPSTWFSCSKEQFRKFNKDLLIYQDEDYINEASVCFFVLNKKKGFF